MSKHFNLILKTRPQKAHFLATKVTCVETATQASDAGIALPPTVIWQVVSTLLIDSVIVADSPIFAEFINYFSNKKSA